MLRARWIKQAELVHRRVEWRSLATRSGFPIAFADPAWVLCWWEHYGEGHEPWTFALEDGDGSLRGLALLALGRAGLSRVLTFAGSSWNGLDALIAAPGAEAELDARLTEALGERRGEWDTWRLHRLPTASELGRRLLGAAGPLRASAHDLRLQPFLALPGDVGSFEAGFGAKQRNTQGRKWRRLLEMGAVPRLVEDPAAIAPALHTLLELRRQRAVAQGQRHEHMDERFERFLLAAVRGLLPERARLWTLELDGRVLASRLNLIQGPREHSYLLGLAAEHPNLSPGNSLELHAIRAAIEEGRTELELGPGRDAYKYRLGGRDRELARIVVASSSMRGRLLSAVPAADLRLRDTAAADAVRRRRGITPERA